MILQISKYNSPYFVLQINLKIIYIKKEMLIQKLFLFIRIITIIFTLIILSVLFLEKELRVCFLDYFYGKSCLESLLLLYSL